MTNILIANIFSQSIRCKNVQIISLLLILSFIACLHPVRCFSQEGSETNLILTATPATCGADGSLFVELSDEEGWSSTLFQLYLLPDRQTPFESNNSGQFSNLVVGRYFVVFSGEFEGETVEIEGEITLTSDYEGLSFSLLSQNLCADDDGKLEVVIQAGSAVSYELVGPVSRPPQSSPLFENLTEGAYTVIVTDECGDRLSRNFQVFRPILEIDLTRRNFSTFLPSCDQITVSHGLRSLNADVEFPLQVSFTVYDPDNQNQEVISLLLEESDLVDNSFFADIPFYHGQAYTYDLSITDNCGYSANALNNTIDLSIDINDDLRWGAGPCGQRRLSIKPKNLLPPFTITFQDFPDEFNPEIFNANYPGPYTGDNIFFGSVANPIPDGFYSLTVQDACGNEASISVNHVQSVGRPAANILKSCGVGVGSVELINFDYQLIEVVLNKAPTAYGITTPVDLSANINVNDTRRFYLNNLPEGTYEFAVKTSCDTEHVATVEIESTVITSNLVEIEENCGTFNLNLDHRDNLAANQNTRYGLQKYFPETDDWGHPDTGVRFSEGDELTNTNAVMLANRANNFNLDYIGDLRVVKSARVWRNGADILPGQNAATFCLETLHTFSFLGQAELLSANFYPCEDENYEVYLDANGYEPITYKIVSKNGLPFSVDNGQNPLFSNLESGRYRFQIQDRCGNITNSTLQLFGSNLPVIKPENLCEGEIGRLFLPEYEFINYEWIREDDPSIILSTGPSLPFEPFDITIHSGLYKVKVSHQDPNSCLNETLEFLIDADNLEALPGVGTQAAICEGNIIDLFDYLEGPFNDYGEWESLSENISLDRSIWLTEGVEAGEYSFQYSISGLCSGVGTSIVTLNLSARVASPTGPERQEFCESTNPKISDLTATGENITWYNSPLGGTPLDPETILESNNVYYAAQTVNGCLSSGRLASAVTIFSEVENLSIGSSQTLYQLETPEMLKGDQPIGGKGEYVYQWQSSEDNLTWEDIPGATEIDYQPEGLLETTHFRRLTEDSACGEKTSNSITISIQVAPIEANGESFGPLKGYETNPLPVMANDLFKGSPASSDEVIGSIIAIENQNGTTVSLPHEWDENGNLVLLPGTPPGNYSIQYEICQRSVPNNCSAATVEVWIGALEIEMEKTVDNERAIVGDLLQFTISIRNGSPFVLDGFLVEDLLPAGFLLLSSAPTALDGGLRWVFDGFAPETVRTITLDVMAVNDGTFSNQVSAAVGDFNITVSSPPVIVRSKSVDLSIEKTSNGIKVADGEIFHYDIIIRNTGLDDATEVVVTDILPNALGFQSADVQSSSPVISPVFTAVGNQLTWEISDFPVGESLSIRLEVVAMDEGFIANEAFVGSKEDDSDMSNNRSRDEMTISPLFIPNVIKPDNDGKNDTFVIRAANKFDQIRLIIFNRWGDVVFESGDYQNDWGAEGLNAGTYYYQLKGTGTTEKQYKGWLQVIK